MWCEDEKIKTVKDLYDYAVENQTELLSDFQSQEPVLYDFWQGYIQGHDSYDRYFCTKYKNWYFFDQDGSETVEEVFTAFVQAVEDFLTVNDKRLTEIYKVELMTVQEASVIADYMVTEEKEGERTVEREYVSGTRSDSTSDTVGEKTDTTTDQIMAFNSSAFADKNKSTTEYGEQENSGSFTKGEQTDNEDVTENTGHTITTIGSKTNPYENMTKYLEAWNGYSFYGSVFREIASELLLIN